MPLALASSELTLLRSPSADVRELVIVSTLLAHREQRITSTRGWDWSIE
jgi:hypothetical protein